MLAIPFVVILENAFVLGPTADDYLAKSHGRLVSLLFTFIIEKAHEKSTMTPAGRVWSPSTRPRP
jgi:hypothetical protein